MTVNIQIRGQVILEKITKGQRTRITPVARSAGPPVLPQINSLHVGKMSTTDALAQLWAEVLMDITMTTNRVPKIKSRHCPVLQDINCDIAYILSHSSGWSAEDTVSELTHSANVGKLQQMRLKIFSHAVGLLIDGKYPNSPDICDNKLKQRRGAKAGAAMALDIVNMFKFLCETDCEFPVSVLKNCGPAPTMAPAHPQENDCAHAAPASDVNSPLHGGTDLCSPLIPASIDVPCAQQVSTGARSPAASPPWSLSGGHSPSLLDLLHSPTIDDIWSPGVLISPPTSPHQYDIPGIQNDPDDFPCVQQARAGAKSPAVTPPWFDGGGDSPTLLSDIWPPGDDILAPSPHTACCCDHGRAIIDLRCTVDMMQMEISRLQTITANFNAMGHAKTWPGEGMAPQATGMPPTDGLADALTQPFPSPPESHPHSAIPTPEISVLETSVSNVSSLSDTLSEVFGLQKRPSGPATNMSDLSSQSGGQNAMAHAGDATPTPCVSCDDSTVQPSGSDRMEASLAEVAYMRDEEDSLRIQIYDFEDRLGATEMSCSVYTESLLTLKELPGAGERLSKQVVDMRGRVETNANKIKKLEKRVKKKQKSKSETDDTHTVVNVKTSNQFAALSGHNQEETDGRTDDEQFRPVKTKMSQRRKSNVPKDKPIAKAKANVHVKVIGASMVRGQGNLISDGKSGIHACCYPNPGFTAEKIQKPLPGMISKRDDAVVILGGTNNVPRDTVGTCITKIHDLIKAARAQNENAHIIFSQIPIRFDDFALNEKSKKSMCLYDISVQNLIDYTSWTSMACFGQILEETGCTFHKQGKKISLPILNVPTRKYLVSNRNPSRWPSITRPITVIAIT